MNDPGPPADVDVDVDVDVDGDFHGGDDVDVDGGDEVERSLSDKPVLEWTADDWHRWTQSNFPTSETATRAGPVVPAEPEAAAARDEWWLERPPPMEERDAPVEPTVEPTVAPTVAPPPVAPPPVAPAPVDLPHTATAAALAFPPLDPADAQAVVPGTRSAPAHRQQRPMHPPGRGSYLRLRSALGLLATSLLVGAVVASLVTVTLFVLSLVLQRAIG